MTRRIPTKSVARWGLLLTSLSMGIVLIGFSAEAWWQSRTIVLAVALGEGEQLIQELGVANRASRRPPDNATFEKFLQEHQAGGVRYVAMIGENGERVAEAGELLEPLSLPGDRKARPYQGWVGDRLRIVRHPPGREKERMAHQRRGLDGADEDAFMRGQRPERAGRGASGEQRPDPELEPFDPDGADALELLEGEGMGLPPRFPERSREAFQGPPGELRDPDGRGEEDGGRGGGAQRPPREGRPMTIVIELQSQLVHDLRQRTGIMLGIGIVVSITLMFSALFFWRQSLMAERMEASFEAQRRLASLGEMSAVLAHEIKNPLAALKGHAQLLEEGLEPGTRHRRKAERVVREVTRLENLVLQLLDFVRSGRVECERVDLLALANEAAEAVDTERITLSIQPEALSAELDRGRMLQVLINLLRNALQASPAELPVELAITSGQEGLHIEVRDRGEGIPVDEQEAIFEPFRTHKTQGVGLGLAVARRIVELHGGKIRAFNRAGGGAVFHIVLPSA